ncbi:hypothetical protein [Mesorhizobium sp. B2-3-5]|uniref:hypothetical protein n=1 Tax=Mesorhizobium sp. B2-3-5 TaxID=2589958 RepID=UPI001128937A|nr:hypothetical protein [Mesorhizobium sp. B2-3-5]TPM21717.1 hypothetical protein FJ958_25415 [Mesorhizobium sp. B2-3-5]
MQERIDQLRLGFELRAKQLSELISGATGGGYGRRPPSDDLTQLDLREFSRRFLSESWSYTQYIASLENLLPDQYRDLMLSYYFSGDLAKNPYGLIGGEFYSVEQMSVVVQTLHENDVLGDAQLCRVVSDGIESLSQILCTGDIEIDSFEKLASHYGRIAKPQIGPVKSLSDVHRMLGVLKEATVHILGPDLTSIFQRLIDPGYMLSDERIARALAITSRWRCGPLFLKCLELRELRKTNVDAEAAGFFNKGEFRLPSDSHDVLSSGLTRLRSLNRFVDDINAEAAVSTVLDIYNADDLLVSWINWDDVYECIAIAERMEGFPIATFHLLLGQAFVGESFPDIKLAEGDGAFESSLRAAVRGLEKKTLEALAQGIAIVTGRCRRLLIESVLRNDTASMLCSILSYDAPWAKRLVETKALTFDARGTAFRRDAARAFQRAKLISVDEAKAIQSEAETSLKVAYLRGRQLEGLVHLNFAHSQRFLAEELGDAILFVKRLLTTPDLLGPEEYIDHVANQLGTILANHVLLSGPSDVKTIISDSLRHGQLPNRFLQAFDKALSLTSPSISEISAFIATLVSAQHPLHWILTLRVELVATIRAFNEQCLTVDESGSLYRRVQSKLVNYVAALIIQEPISPVTEEWQAQVRGEIEDMLRYARAELAERIKAYVSSAINTISFGGNHQTASFNKAAFSESLSQQVYVALEESEQWIALSKISGTPRAFTITEIVQLCLVTHVPTSGKKHSLKVVVSGRRKGEGIVIFAGEPKIDGRYFELIESICKNLIGNCYRHSGQGTDTRAVIEVVIGHGRLTVELTNSLSTPRYRQLSQALDSLRKEAKNPALAKASEDSSSGFSKIAWSCNKEFGVVPRIQLTLGAKPLSLKVSVDIRYNGGSIVTKAHIDR